MANIERLQQLRRVVEAAPDDRFDMSNLSRRTDCGTAYCAVGWAYQDPWFRDRGVFDGILSQGGDGMVRPEQVWFYSSLAEAFELDEDDADRLFQMGRFAAQWMPRVVPPPATKAEVLWNIDELLAGRPARPYRSSDQPGTPGPTVPVPGDGAA